jgi:hypothetical protein
MSVVPIAKEKYERREEQVFREYVRRNVDQATYLAQNAFQRMSDLPTYADDAAAGVGGLIKGTYYKTATGQVMVKL